MKKEEKIGTPETKKSEVKAGYLSLFKSSFSLAVTVVALIAAAIAWFASNSTVTTENSQISAKRPGFELESEGEMEIHKDLLQYLNTFILQWQLAQDSNLQNYGDQAGIRPNSSGSLSFYVVPLADGPLSINCTLDIRPVMKTEQDAAFDTAAKILRGHLLFAYEYECGDTKEQALVDVRNGTFQIQLPENTTAQQRQKITLHWFWPYTLHDANNHDTYGNEISAMTGNPEYADYFFYDKTNTTGSVDVNSAFKILNQHYNDGDQLIGDKVKAVVLELTADLAL